MITEYVFAALLIYAAGVVTGWLVGVYVEEISKCDLRTIIALVVTAVWVITIIGEMLIATYTVSVLIHGIMGAVAGYLFSEDGLDITLGSKK